MPHPPPPRGRPPPGPPPPPPAGAAFPAARKLNPPPAVPMRAALPPEIQPAHASTFRALRHRNFRLWFFGQLTSLVGTWMQTIAQNWLRHPPTASAGARRG